MSEPDIPPTDRRSFIKEAACVAFGACAVAVPLAAGVRVLVSPIGIHHGDGYLVKLTTLGALPAGGAPLLFEVQVERTDAWTRHPLTAIGAVFLQRVGDREVRAFNASCPHLGCAVEWRTESKNFFCPCHASSFAMDGVILPPSPAARQLDALDVEIREGEEVWVRFLNFKAGVAEKNRCLVKALFDWLDHRTGYRALTRAALFEHVPGGARWRYVWGSTLTFLIVVQFITGIFLWMHYAASAQSAWESVYYIQEVMPGGWWLRGIHHFAAQLMVPLLILHFMQVIIDGAYRAPREINYWFGLGLLMLTLALSLTGYLLPWDQKGYWATKVATNLVATMPVVGDTAQRILVGDANYGHHTLTRFFALHAGVLPALLVGLIFVHVALFRRHGLTAAQPIRKPDTTFWPDQVLCDAVACLAVIAAVLGLVWYFQGAELTAPANPAEQYSAARPDWYFMALFQLLKFFEGERLIWGSLIIPSLVFLLLALMPFLGRWRIGHGFNFLVVLLGLAAYSALTVIAFRHDHDYAPYRAAVAQGERDAARVKLLAKEHQGIPPAGALTLLHEDPLTQGPRLFAAKCASCHTFNGHDGLGAALPESVNPPDPNDPAGPPTKGPTAPDLAGFGSREWLTGLLDPAQIESVKYFGRTAFAHPAAGKKKSKMVRYVTEDVPKFSDDEKQQLGKIIAALSAEAKLPGQAETDARDLALITEGGKLLGDSALKCADCHAFHVDDPGSGPDLTGYASRDWMVKFIQNPSHEKFYGDKNDRMPLFGEKGELTERQIGFIVDWLRSGVRY